MRFSPLGDSAIRAECGDGISPQTLRRVRDFATAVGRAAIPGVVDIVPAFTTVTVFYVPTKTAALDELSYAYLREVLSRLAEVPAPPVSIQPAPENFVEIPVCYSGEHGPDLTAVAQHVGESAAAVIELHQSPEYLVHAIGFSPGFPYLGGLPPELQTPRLATPRVKVPAGSVGIGGAQTGVYPLETPGGWQLIGRTPLQLFDVQRPKPALLRIGDKVRFRAITAKEFANASRAAARQSAAAESPGQSDAFAGMRILRAGMSTTVQDLGRVGHRAEGVPLSGAVDAVALRVANGLVGNLEEAAGLEFTLVGPEIEFTATATVALGGATFAGFPSWQPVQVAAGTRINFGPVREGCRGYLAVAGGLKIERVLGSASTLLRAGFGGMAGRALREGDRLAWHPPVRELRREGWHIDLRVLPPYSSTPTIRVVAGAQAEGRLALLLASEFSVTPRSDRMGLRLSGPALNQGNSNELISAAVAPGTIQLPSDGQPIVLLADAQTIGGYPQLAHVITVDLPLLAQLKPGDRLRFEEVSLDEAQKLLLVREHVLAILHEGLMSKLR